MRIRLPADVARSLETRHEQRRAEAEGPPRLDDTEWILTDPRAFGLVEATPVQRAWCRVVDGRPLGELANDPDVLEAFGGVIPTWQPTEVCYVAAIRGAKSQSLAAVAFRASQTVDVSPARANQREHPRFSIVSVDTDKAKVVYDHLLGGIERSPLLSKYVIGEPKESSMSLLLRHPTGRPIEVRVVAGARAGKTLVSRWSAGCAFDEGTRMVGVDEGVVNLDDSKDAVAGRLLPGAQMFYVGSAWAPIGPMYRMFCEHFGKPSTKLFVVKAKGWQLNPSWWTPERCRDLEERNPVAYACDVLSEFKSPEGSMFDPELLVRSARREPAALPFDPLCSYAAGMDPATRGNAWTLVVVGHVAHGRYAVVHAQQWRGTPQRPLSPLAVLQEIAAVLARYRLRTVRTDKWSIDAIRELASQVALSLAEEPMQGPERVEMFDRLLFMLKEQALELPPDPRVREDLLRVRRIVSRQSISIDLEKTQDGRHADYAPALALACRYPLPSPRRAALQPGTPEWFAAEEERWMREAERRRRKQRDDDRVAVNEVRDG